MKEKRQGCFGRLIAIIVGFFIIIIGCYNIFLYSGGEKLDGNSPYGFRDHVNNDIKNEKGTFRFDKNGNVSGGLGAGLLDLFHLPDFKAMAKDSKGSVTSFVKTALNTAGLKDIVKSGEDSELFQKASQGEEKVKEKIFQIYQKAKQVAGRTTIQNESSKDLSNDEQAFLAYVSQLQLSGDKAPISNIRDIDGDTIEATLKGRKTTFRFVNIDTPECVKPNTPVQPYAKEAKKFTEDALKKAKKIAVQFDFGETKDKYGRYLVYVFTDESLLNLSLVQEGLAKVTNVQKANTRFLAELKSAEYTAKLHQRNIWSK